MDPGWLAGFISQLWDALMALWPWTYVRWWQRAVRFNRGRAGVVLHPGLRRNLVMLDHFEVLDARRYWRDCPDQVLSTYDDIGIMVSGQVEIQITNPYKFATVNATPMDAIDALVLSRQARILTQQKYEDIGVEDLEREIVRALRPVARKWGVRIFEFNINQLARTSQVLWHAGQGMAVSVIPGEADD